MTLRARLTLAFGALAALILVVSTLALKELADANDRFTGYVEGINARQLLANDVLVAVGARAIAARDLLNTSGAADRDRVKAEVTRAHEQIGGYMARLLDMAAQPDVLPQVRALVKKIDEVERQYAPVALTIVQLALDDRHAEAVAMMNAECRPLLEALTRATHDYVAFSTAQAADLTANAAAQYAFKRNLLIGACLVAFLAAGLSGALITRSLTRALGAEPGALGEIARRVAAGDLSPMAQPAGAVPGSVLDSLRDMQQSLARIVGEVRTGSDNIATASTQIATGNADLSHRTEEQASNLQETASSMEQLSETSRTSADTAREANRLAALAAAAAEHGGQVVNQVVGTMRDISAASQEISDIIGVIDGIAFQTNILALNAAVEAARAGEQGRGFAVVAGEVRTLAQRSAEAAKEIKSLIGASVEKVGTGARQVDDAGASMSEIVAQVQGVSRMIDELSHAYLEQSQGIAQVGEAVQQLDEVTQHNAALVEETAAAAQSLSEQAARLTEAMSVFKLRD